jgi:hypothetical protein
MPSSSQDAQGYTCVLPKAQKSSISDPGIKSSRLDISVNWMVNNKPYPFKGHASYPPINRQLYVENGNSLIPTIMPVIHTSTGVFPETIPFMITQRDGAFHIPIRMSAIDHKGTFPTHFSLKYYPYGLELL